MDKYLCRKDVYEELLEKAMRDRSHLTQKQITDKNGHKRTVWVKPGENPEAEKGTKQPETTEKKAAKPKYSVGDRISLDGAKGVFRVSSIDEDGAYHVVSLDGKTGYKVSENHINGSEKTNMTNRELTDDNMKVRNRLQEIVSMLKKEKDPDKTEELQNQMRDIQLNGSKSKYFNQSATSDDKSKIGKKWIDKINNAKTIEELKAAEPSNEYDKIYDNESKYNEAELNQIDSDFREASKLYDEKLKELGKQNKTEPEFTVTDEIDKGDNEKSEYQKGIEELRKTDPEKFHQFMKDAKRDYKNYQYMKQKSNMVNILPYLKDEFEYKVAVMKVNDYEKKYPDFAEKYDKNMAEYDI